MKADKKYNIIFLIIFFGICIYLFISGIFKSENLKNKIYTDYPALSKKDKLENLVISDYQPPKDILRNSPEIVFVTLDNSKKYRIWAENIQENNLGINNVLGLGDTVLKKANNDSIFIIKTENSIHTKYLFLLIEE